MSESKVQGKNAILKAFNVDGYYVFYCAQTVELNIEVEQLPATNINGGGYKGNKPGKTSWEINLSGVMFVRDTSDLNWTAADLWTEQARKNGLDLQLLFTNDNGNYEQFTGHGNPATTNAYGTAGELSKFSVRFVGDGLFQRNAVIPPSTTSDVKRYEFTGSGGETFFTYSDLIGRTIDAVIRENNPALGMITSGTPSEKQFKYISSSGKIEFAATNPIGSGEIIIVLYK